MPSQPLSENAAAVIGAEDLAAFATKAAPARPIYPPPADMPTQEGPLAIRFDFNFGPRVFLPERHEGMWQVVMRDLDTGKVLAQAVSRGGLAHAFKRHFIRVGIEVSHMDGPGATRPVFTHAYDARGRDVIVQFPEGALGKTLGWFGHAARFGALHGCRLTCAMQGAVAALLRGAYPDIRFVTHAELEDQRLHAAAYATYSLGLLPETQGQQDRPVDFRAVGPHRVAAHILGVDPAEEPARLALPDETRPIAEPYVCIAVQATAQCKTWNNPLGWHELVAALKRRGYRVICIDQKRVDGAGLVWNHIPHGAEDETGSRPLAERARWLRHADAFIGLSGGLSWLAWSAGCPVVLISGFSDPVNEFATPFRVINRDVCNSCLNDLEIRFDRHDRLWCPRHAGTPRQFECTKTITAAQVMAAFDRIPNVRNA
jgi:autotransporter strand-loop-strand O-heptosyltransferase